MAVLVSATFLPQPTASASPQGATLAPSTVPLIGQIFSPAEYTGKTMDSGLYDCLVASVAMDLQGLQQEGLLTPTMSDADRYSAVRHAFRSQTPDASSGLSADLAVALMPQLTANELVAAIRTDITADNWLPVLQQQLDAGYPVPVNINDWHKLAAGWGGSHPHTIVVTGLQGDQVLYNDPWNGKAVAPPQRWSMSDADFAAAWGYRGANGLMAPFIATTINRAGASLPPVALATPVAAPASPTPAATIIPTATAFATVTPKPVAKPGGLWVGPADGSTITQPALHLAAHAYPTNAGDPPIDHVNFTLWWPQIGLKTGPWALACTAKPPPSGDVFACDADIGKLGVPAGQLAVSFDAYDAAGNKHLAPNGERSISYAPPTPTPLPSIRAVDWNKVLRDDPDLIITGPVPCPVPVPVSVIYRGDPQVEGLVGTVFYGDIAGDGGEEAILPLGSAVCSPSGGDWSLLVYRMTPAGPRIAASLRTGLGLDLKILGGRLNVTYQIWLPGDTNFAPTGGTQKADYQLKDGRLVALSSQHVPPSASIMQRVPESFPLYQYLPYATSDFEVTSSEQGKRLQVKVKIADINKVKAGVEAWIRSHSVDPSTHTVDYVR